MINSKKWYMVTVVSGKEKQVIEFLKNRIIAENISTIDQDIKVMFVPHITAREYQKKNEGKDYKLRERNLYPGYIFVKMEMTDETWFIVRNTQFVTGLVGSSGKGTKPTPITELKMKKMEDSVEKIRSDFDSGKIKSPFIVGKMVEIIDGPSKGLIGPIVANDDENKMATIELIIFERKTPTQIEHKNLKIKT